MSQPTRPRRRQNRLAWGIGALLIIGGIVAGFITFNRNQPSNVRLNYALVRPQISPISATVNASGAIQPQQVLDLTFASSGLISEVFVQVGDQVAAGQELARLDTRDLELRVDQAAAQLAQAQANLERLRAGPSEAEVKAAEAQLAQAQAQLRQTTGNVTEKDLAAAQAQVDQARANLERLLGGPKASEVAQAQAQVDQAAAALQAQRDSLSAAKTRAESQLLQAANTLRDRQAEYSRIYNDNREREQQLARFGQSLPQSALDTEAAALRAVQNAEEQMRQAQVAYEQARQAEITGIAQAEAQLRSAQANLERILSGAEADQVAAARAQLAQAEANLNKLLGDQRAGSLAAAQAAVASAQANLQRITSPPSEADLASAEAQIANARAGLAQAQLALERATLKAPIAGVVAEVNLEVGEFYNAARPAIVLADLSGYYVDVTVDEIDVAQIAVGQPVTLVLDALPNLDLRGTVARINPLSILQSGVTAYTVRIVTTDPPAAVRPGMSASADIVVAEKNEALVVPRRAMRAESGQFFVDITVDPALCDTDIAQRPLQPPLRAVAVKPGLSNEQVIEITDGEIDTNSCVYVPGVDARINLFNAGGPPPGVRNR
ncbi:efflux RND transporter periplasmic adaptor subunit [Chloroflexus sp.]|uniref:efflux RND transporter periplasmic adaptor subunit n=1 Tax=Chloroflexus sp. TaxID=1904827 RepID=UPI00263577FE|nr:efflux RND transporter periplasmic adaptor subunit [uncultured Chloroflexus sp.]